MPCVGSPCSSARTRWSAAASAILEFAPALSRAARASPSKVCASFFTARILTMGKMIELTASDGHKLAAYRADPSGKPRGGIVVIQEIFGVNSHIRSVADGYAADGYLAIAPAMFDRYEPKVDLGYTPEHIARGRDLKAKAGVEQALADIAAARD